MAIEPAQPKSTGKTKAKSRYLKRKKDRRKQRISEVTTTKVSIPSTVDNEARTSGDETESEEEVGQEQLDNAPEVKEPGTTVLTKTIERARKKRKLDSDSVSESASDASDAEEIPVEVRSRSASPQAALSSFPLPVAPDAPSKATLALQGLDAALLGAEVIDPSLTLPINALNRPPDQLPVLSDKMKKRLDDLGISDLFAVQTALLPFLLPPRRRQRALYCPYDPPQDVCASAPTGSGKTLAYVVPIVEILSVRIAIRLRALIVLPTRDLVMQVQETFEAVSKGRGLKIAVATGQHSFAHEQNQLIADQSRRLQGGSSKVDILICTPGRLIDHLNGTPNFSLQHLRFLVIDEADRLLAQSFQDWLAQVLSAIRSPQTLNDSVSSLSLTKSATDTLPYHDALAPTWLHTLHGIRNIPTDFDDVKESSCQKLLFSATLTRDPSKIAAIGLRDPKYFIVRGWEESDPSGTNVHVTEKFTMPPTLKEHMLVCSSAQKPLMLFHLMRTHDLTNALIFTKSAESTTRLVRLFDFFQASLSKLDSQRQTITMQAYSSDLSASERKSILEKFKTKEINILVCSDLISRGIDISHVSHVVSYDAPVDMRKYVHRVGRTARAGRSGDAWTLVEDQEARHFKLMMREAEHLNQIKKMKVADEDLKELVPHYEAALSKLKDAYSRS